MYKEQNPKDADLTILTWSVKGETTMLEDCFERKGIKDSLYVMNIDKPFNWLDKIKTIQIEKTDKISILKSFLASIK